MSSGGVVQPLLLEGQAAAAAGAALHEQLVSYTDTICGALSQETRSGVWGEHSYARARSGAPSASVRVLLAQRPPPDDDRVDVTAAPRPPPRLPHDDLSDDSEPEPDADEDDDWEGRVAAHPPSSAHARLALGALGVLREARLARLAAAGGRGGRAARAADVRAAARRLRALLAPLWAGPGAPALRPPAWLHAQLQAHLPAAHRRLYEDILAELRRDVPRLADRLLAARLPTPVDDPLAPDKCGELRGPNEPGPWLAWVRCGCERAETRWERRLGALLHTRVLSAAGPTGPPERWAAAVMHSLKQALADVIEDARGRAVIVGGAGAGAAMAAALAAGGAALAGALLVGAAPHSAEGPRALPDDALHEVSVPTLVVAGGRGAGELAGGARRVLAVCGADAALRLPLRARRRLRLPQHALDAALAEEMARWAGALGDAPRDAEYAHLPPAAPPDALSTGINRAVEFVEGRVVARVSGSTPLLLTPRRAAPAAPPSAQPPALAAAPLALAAAPPALAAAPEPALAAADIMQLPIVFADDDPPAVAYSDSNAVDKPVTVTSGARGGGAIRYTRVIVAKRGARGVGAGGPLRGPGGAVRGAGGAVRGAGGAAAAAGRRGRGGRAL
ncbi:uncharacterized protein [Epargyreus clarus]|uniref:uncharacterized protein n=1 Tax=Epargyreus clarus TaxID=520877 RepID=UPI003C2BA9E2